mgnify:CR=1 FL=1
MSCDKRVKKSNFPCNIAVRLAENDRDWIAKQSSILRVTEGNLARVLLGYAIDLVRDDAPSLLGISKRRVKSGDGRNGR